LDTLTNERAVYPSINEVARAIGVTAGAISTAFKKKTEKGETSPTIEVKKRYKITKLSSN
jgi:predicted transcriptional regulator